MNLRIGRRALAAIMTALLMAGAALPASANNELEDLLEEVGKGYAQAYLAPLINTFGPNLNGGIYSTAAIPQSKLTFEFGFKVTATHLAETDQTFQRVLEDVELRDFDGSFPAGQTGDVVLSGPTVFGDPDTEGSIVGYVNGVQVFSQPGIEGLIKSRYSPVPVPQASLGGVAGFRATVRWLPEISAGEFGKVKMLGYGLQWSPNTVMPHLPVDVMVGFFKQSFDVGTLIASEANSVFLAAGKSWPFLTLYGGYAKEDSEMTVSYVNAASGLNIDIAADDVQDSRMTVGATLNVLARLNLEMGHGELTTYTAGLLFGF